MKTKYEGFPSVARQAGVPGENCALARPSAFWTLTATRVRLHIGTHGKHRHRQGASGTRDGNAKESACIGHGCAVLFNFLSLPAVSRTIHQSFSSLPSNPAQGMKQLFSDPVFGAEDGPHGAIT